jgi:hypothetical protein
LSNIILKNTTSSIFLAIVLITGTFAAVSPSSFITGVNADQCGEDVKACFQQFLSMHISLTIRHNNSFFSDNRYYIFNWFDFVK